MGVTTLEEFGQTHKLNSLYFSEGKLQQLLIYTVAWYRGVTVGCQSVMTTNLSSLLATEYAQVGLLLNFLLCAWWPITLSSQDCEKSQITSI